MLVLLLMTSASMFHAINWLSPLQFSTFTMICGIMGFYGGVEIVGKEDKYVLRTEWIQNTGKIYEKSTKTTENTSKLIALSIKD